MNRILIIAIAGLCFSGGEAFAEESFIVEDRSGYNAWPMIQAIGGDKLICAYSRGSGHSIHEGRRDAFARISKDGDRLRLALTAGETFWLRLYAKGAE